MTFRDNCVPLPQMENQRRKKEADQVRYRRNKRWQWLSAKWYGKEIENIQTVRERFQISKKWKLKLALELTYVI